MGRTLEILNILLSAATPVTVDTIASRLRVSNKTIRNDLEQLEEYVKSRGLRIIKKPGSGVTVEGTEEQKLKLIHDVKSRTGNIEPFSPEARKNYILKRLLINEKQITIKELAEELYVSRVTIHKDLADVERWIKKYRLKLLRKTNYGIELTGEEENWRNAVASLIAVHKEQDELKELLSEDYGGRIDYKTMTKLRELINLDYKQLEKIVTGAEGQLKFRFSDEAYISLVIHIAIAIKRLKGQKDIRLSKHILDHLRGREEYSVAAQIARDIGESFRVELPESEIGYILLHILGAKMQQSKGAEINVNLAGEKHNELAVLMAREIVNIAANVLSLNLREDQQLVNGLILHLRPTINRLKYGLTLRNPILKEIKENYPEIYGVAWMTSVVFERYLGQKIGEEEIGYIALHLGAAVERAKKPLRALVVCASGIGTSQLLAAKLGRYFREIEIKDIVSVMGVKERPLDDVDIVISTVPIEIDKPALNISPLLGPNDIKRLERFIGDLGTRKQNVGTMIAKELIDASVPCGEKEAVISQICAQLYAKGYVEEGFAASVLARENTAPTNVGNGVAIPHGSPEYVNKSVIALTVLHNPVSWGQEDVNIILMLGIAPAHVKHTGRILRNLYNQLDSAVFLNRLAKTKDKGERMKILEEITDAH